MYNPPPGAWAPPVQTPGVPVFASFGRRFGALLIDGIGLGIVALVIAAAINLPGTAVQTTTASGQTSSVMVTNSGWSSVLMAVLSAAYAIGLWVSSGATLGQRALGLHVYGAEGPRPLTVDRAAIRWFLLFGVLYLVGAIVVAAPDAAGVVGLVQLVWVIVLAVTTYQSPTKQGLHDKYAGSLVVRG
jgi:uncharacterized RDD family membrane protein YckC